MNKVTFFLLVVFCVTSCRKSSRDCSATMNNAAGSYKITKVLYSANQGLNESDITATYDACKLDDIYVLNSNGVLELNDAGTPCIPSQTGSWSLVGNSMTLGGNMGFMSNFNCSGFVFTTNSPLNPAETWTFHYTRQ